MPRESSKTSTNRPAQSLYRVNEENEQKNDFASTGMCIVVITAFMLLMIGVGCSVLVFYHAEAQEIDSVQREFAQLMKDTALHIDNTLSFILTTEAHVGVSLARDNGTILPQEVFQRQAEYLQTIQRGLNSISFSQRVMAPNRLDFEANVFGGVPILAPSSTGVGPVPYDTAELWPLVHSVLRPEAASAGSMDGFDLFSSPPIVPPIKNATDTYSCQTARYISIVDGLRLLGVMCPIYSPAIPVIGNSTVEERREEVFGVVVITIRTLDLIQIGLLDVLPAHTGVVIEDVGDSDDTAFGESSGIFLLNHDPNTIIGSAKKSATTLENVDPETLRNSDSPYDLTFTSSTAFANRPLRLEFYGTHAFANDRLTSNPWFLLAAGLMVTFFLMVGVAVAAVVVRGRDHAHAQAVISEERDKRLMAQAAKDAHEKTLGYACHELRNPLHAISASAAFLAETIAPTDEAFEDVQAIVSGSQQMHRLVNDVLDWGKLRAGKLSLNPVPFDIRAAVQELVMLHQGMCNPGVELTSVVDSRVPTTVVLDSLRVRQLLSNGLTNALKLTRQGAIRMHISMGAMMVPLDAMQALHGATEGTISAPIMSPARGTDTNLTEDSSDHRFAGPPVRAKCVVFEVVDTGPGLNGVDPAALFEPFSQGFKSPTAKKADGSVHKGLLPRLSQTRLEPPIPLIPSSASGADLISAPSGSSFPSPSGSAVRIRPSVSTAQTSKPAQVLAKPGKKVSTQGAGAHSHAKAGTGLGLPICKQLVSLMHGSIGLEERTVTATVTNTVFWFCLPVPDAAYATSPLLEADEDADAEDAFTGSNSSQPAGHVQGSPRVSYEATRFDSIRTLMMGDDELLPENDLPVDVVSPLERTLTPPQRLPSLPPPAPTPSSSGRPRTSWTASPPSPVDVDLQTTVSTVTSFVPGVVGGRLTPSPPVARRLSPAAGAAGSAAEVKASPRRATETKAAPQRSTAGAKKKRKLNFRCLIVDDELVNRRVCIRMLKRLGCTHVDLEDGDQILDTLKASGYGNPAVPFERFDVILLDIMMERTNGVDVLRDLLARFPPTSATPLPPCVAVTGNTSMQDNSLYKATGFRHVLSKPFNADALRSAMLAATRMSRSTSRQLSASTPSLDLAA